MDFSALLPLTVGAALLPVWIVIVLFLLRGEGGVRRATAFVAGAVLVRLAQGILFGFVFGTAGDESGQEGATLIAPTLLLLVGVVMLITGVKKWRKEEDPDDPPPRWMTMLDGVPPLKAFGLGALLMAVAIKQWVFTLSAIAVVEEAQLTPVGSMLAYLFFVLAAQSLMLAPIVVVAAAPAQSARLLATAETWLTRNSRVIMIAVSLIFGLWFLWKGVTGLLA